MRPIECTLASYGLFGRPLNEVSDSVVDDARAHGTGEVAPASEMLALKNKWTTAPTKNAFRGPLDQLENREEYVLRLSTDEWARLILKGCFKGTKYVSLVSSALLLHPEGLDEESLVTLCDEDPKQIKIAAQKLVSKNLATVEGGEGSTVYKYVINPITIKLPLPQEEDSTPSPELYIKAYMTGLQAPQTLETAAKILKLKHQALIDMLMAHEKDWKLKVFIDANNNPVILPDSTGEVERDALIFDFIAAKKAFVLSDYASDLSCIKPSLSFSPGGEGIDFLEAHNYFVVEMFAKFVTPEYIVHIPNVSKDDEIFHVAYERGMVKVGLAFRRKLKRAFLIGPAYVPFDNGYEPDLEKRTKNVLEFIESWMTQSGGRFVLDKKRLIDITFGALSSFAVLKQEGLLTLLATACGYSPLIQETQVDDESEAYAEYYTKCKQFLADIPMAHVLEAVEKVDKKLAEALQAKCSPSELVSVLTMLAKKGALFVTEDDAFIYFEVAVPLSEAPSLLRLSKIDDVMAGPVVPIPMETRVRVFAEICEFTPNEFVQRARISIQKAGLDDATKGFYLRRLRNFK